MDDMQKRMQEMMKRQWTQKVKMHSMLNKMAKKGQIVFAGSSLAENFPICEMLQNLDKRYIVYNRGIGGDVTTGMLERMDTTIFQLEPSKVFINIGTNDISRPGYQRETLLANYRETLRQIRERLPDTTVYVMSFYPVNRELPSIDPEMVANMFGARTNEELKAVNAELEKLAGEMGCRYIDLFDCLLDERGNLREEYAVDGMHMYPNGYAVVLEKLLPYFDE